MTLAYNIAATDPILSTLPDGLVQDLPLLRRRRITINRGQSFIAGDQDLTAVYLIADGWAVSQLHTGNGDTQILDILGPGSLAGITRLSSPQRDEFSVVALQDVDAYRIDSDRLKQVCAHSPSLSVWLNYAISHQSQRMQRHITALGQLPARGRLAYALLRIIDVAQQSGPSAVGRQIRLPMTQEEIGNMLGLTNVSISKLMSTFRKAGLIDYGRNRITVKNVDALSDICGMTLETVQRAKSGFSA